MKRLLIIALLVWVSLATICPTVLAQGDYLIIPGQRIGSFALGMSRDDAVRILGRPTDIVGDPNHPEIGQTCFWGTQNFNISFSGVPEMQAKTIVSSNQQYVTAEGVRAGSSGSDVVRVYGKEYERVQGKGVVFVIYHKLGLQFMISETNNSVLWVAVQVPN